MRIEAVCDVFFHLFVYIHQFRGALVSLIQAGRFFLVLRGVFVSQIVSDFAKTHPFVAVAEEFQLFKPREHIQEGTAPVVFTEKLLLGIAYYYEDI